MWNFARQTSPTFQGWGKDITLIGEVAGEVDWRSGGYPPIIPDNSMFAITKTGLNSPVYAFGHIVVWCQMHNPFMFLSTKFKLYRSLSENPKSHY